jgi:hypothetical protein
MKRTVALFVAAALASPLLLTTTAQSAESAPKNWKAPRTADGHPDLQGVWTNATITPLERQPQFGDRLSITEEEAKALEKEQADFREEQNKPTDPTLGILDLPKDCGGGFSGVNCGYNNFWVDPGNQMISINGERRTSIVVEPKNGRVPALKPEARARLTKLYAAYRSSGGADGPEVRPLGERCILSFDSSAGPPMLPLLYNNNYQIVQTANTVVILVEMVHDARIVRMNAQHRPANMRFWMGDSIGRWEGDTLVIETTNFRTDQIFRGASENLKVTERLTRISPQQIVYRFTIEDPTSFETSWTGELALNANQQNIYEYACHEGNYALPGILAGAREEERAKAAGAAPSAVGR